MTSGMLGVPPIMNRSFAAWFMIWSKATPAKSENCSSTTGRRPVSAAPIPQPTKPLSESGVSRTRSAPKRSWRPSVARKIPPTLPMSSPMRITSWSASSSSSSASRTAATKPSVRSVSIGRLGMVLLRCERGGEEIVVARVRVGERRLDRGLDLALDVLLDRPEPLVVQLAELPQEAFEARERILRLPLGDECGVAGVGQVRPHRVLHAPEGLQLDERRAVAVARPRQRASDRVLDREQVVPVHDLAGHPVAGSALGEILDGPLRPPVGGERELVVLADEDDRQRPGRREVHRLVRRALAGGAVAEERDHGLAGVAQLGGERGARRVRQARADDPVAAENLQLQGGDVHRAAEPPAVARLLAEHLGHHPAQVGAGRDQVAVRAVMPDEVVGLAHDPGGADGDRLLPDAAVRGAEDDAFLEELRGAILEAADQRHPTVLLEEWRPVGRTLASDGRLERAHRVNVLRRWAGCWSNESSLVTGAASGIGKEIADRFAPEGARVAGFDRSGDVAFHGRRALCRRRRAGRRPARRRRRAGSTSSSAAPASGRSATSTRWRPTSGTT